MTARIAVPAALPAYARLPQGFPVEPLQRALAELPETAWQPHFNRDYFEGDWSGIALLAPADAPDSLLAGHGEPVATPLLEASPFWQDLLARLPGPIRSARLLRLGPGARIREHRDPDLGGDDSDLRLHLPIHSHEAVEFILEGRAIPMRPGELWFLDLSRSHRVENPSPHARIHLVLDCRRTPELLERIAAGLADTPPAQEARGTRQFALFRAAVHRDAELQRRLQAIDDAQSFAETAVALAAGIGLHFSEEDVRAAMQQGRRSWIEQWVI
ncbi:aspartyl/asparaginyl beta-hydroxylase domain-containing protein [Pseudomonas indica]|uniref:aspartyl/asparaginyl beta-hydroxylase domain-containing protein n=1 Tax=Pseudomonas indica TaxID=137658 RepID=UPI000BAB7855|nr:aspartyl/asparaginyl beta-hydroxylase domain-containing protein [Pseudomonas indica]PAU63438.1 aspartyl beta-hydroxylase [Pseudomonas indica]